MARDKERDKEKDRERKRAWRAANLERVRGQQRAWRAANLERVRGQQRAWRAANPEKGREYKRAERAANPEKDRERWRAWLSSNKENRREWERAWRATNLGRKRAINRKSRTGWSHEMILAGLASQAWRCAICTAPLLKPNADHCHATGRPRGLLCRACNTSLGFYEKRQRPAGLRIEPYEHYLANPPAVRFGLVEAGP